MSTRWLRILPGTGFSRIHLLADGLNSGNDNFLLLRLLAASLVIYGHGSTFTNTRGMPDVLAWLGGGYSGDVAVDVFFVASGFMVAGSYLRRCLLDFLWARTIRIYPAYLLCLFGCAYGLGAIYTELPLADYFGNHEVARYVSKNVQLSHGLIWSLPGVFKHSPKTDTVNGVIWTLPAEVRMYLWVALLGGLGILARRRWCNVLIILLFAWGLLEPVHIPMVPLDVYRRLAAYFALGVFCYVNRESIPVGWPVVISLALLAWLVHATAIYPFVFGLALASFVFAFAYATPWHGFNRLGDYSYGLYLWGYPLQQVIAYHMAACRAAAELDAGMGGCHATGGVFVASGGKTLSEVEAAAKHAARQIPAEIGYGCPIERRAMLAMSIADDEMSGCSAEHAGLVVACHGMRG